jgi:exonuclease SbcC
MVLKSQLPAINSELGKILEGIVDFKVSLDTDIKSNVMDVFIEDVHSRRIIELASGMEKTIASMALRVALINLSSLPKSDILIIDEGFGALDEENIQSCMEMLTLLRGYFKTIIIISHVTAIKEVADRIIEVKHDGLESKVETV